MKRSLSPSSDQHKTPATHASSHQPSSAEYWAHYFAYYKAYYASLGYSPDQIDQFMLSLHQQSQSLPQPPTPTSTSNPASSRTLFFGKIPSSTRHSDILDHIHCGMIEYCCIVTEKNIAFVTFVRLEDAQVFMQTCNGQFSILNKTIKVDWAKHAETNDNAMSASAISQGATRNVCIANLDLLNTDAVHVEQWLRQTLGDYGMIDHIELLRESGIAQIHLDSILNAVRCVNALVVDPVFRNRKIGYGRDRCEVSGGIDPFLVAQQQYALQKHGMQALVSNMPEINFATSYGLKSAERFVAPIDPYTAIPFPSVEYKRTLYIGNLPEGVTYADLFNSIRGGLVERLVIIPQKVVAFCTFVSSQAAYYMYSFATNYGVKIKGRTLKIAWGKERTTPTTVIYALRKGATRALYLGNFPEDGSEDFIRKSFEQFGEIEKINIIAASKCAFVSFTEIESAIKAYEGRKEAKLWPKYKLKYGRDRCFSVFKEKVEPVVAESAELVQQKDAVQPKTDYYHQIFEDFMSHVVDIVEKELRKERKKRRLDK